MTELEALLRCKAAWEAADIHGIVHLLSDDCAYVSTGRGTIGRNRNEVIQFIAAMMESVQADAVPVYCHIVRIVSAEEDSLFTVGKIGLSVSYELGDNHGYLLLLDVGQDGSVERIVSTQEAYGVERVNLRLLDIDEEPAFCFIHAPVSAADWMTALSMWLETNHMNLDDFYQYIDEDAKVVYQKGNSEAIALENGLDVADYLDQLMNFYVDDAPHILRDEEAGLILTYGPLSLIVAITDTGALSLINMYVDGRYDEEVADDYGYIEETVDEWH